MAVVSPAGAAKRELVEAGCAQLREAGYEPVLMPHALARGPLYYAGTKEERAADLLAAYADRSIEAIFCTRGGWGSAELLPLMDWDLVKANPKPLVGYSDVTSLHVWLWNECRAVGVHGPLVAADWAKGEGVERASWGASIERRERFRFGKGDGLMPLREGVAEGRLLGGCLTILEAGLGTPYGLRVEEPTVLFVEDTGVKPYQWDRMLQHLRFAGVMERVVGVVLGDMGACVGAGELELMRGACMHAMEGLGVPVAWGLRSGHVDRGNRSLVLGTMARLECAEGEARLSVEGWG